MAPSFSPWTDLLVEELERLWAAGYSATLIAGMLGDGMTRCSVLGKINRLGLHRRRPPVQRKERAPPIKRGRPIVRRPVFEPSQSPLEPPAPPPEADKRQWHEAPGMRKLQLLALRDHHCRAPIGEPGRHPFYYCAANVTTPGRPYCDFHLAKAYLRSKR